MRILVAVATRHGATREIAEQLATSVCSGLADAGIHAEAVVRDASLVTTIEGFDAVIIGSALYMGHWLDAATKLTVVFPDQLKFRPVWLFSSGPVGEPLKPAEDPAGIDDLVEAVDARGHRLFGGKLDRAGLHFPERALVAALRVKDGDFRDWPMIRAWGYEIALSLADARNLR